MIIYDVNFLEVSYNKPKFSVCAYWDPDGITFANNVTVNFYPYSLFVDRNNTVYVADNSSGRVYQWHESSTTMTRTIFDNLLHPSSLFVTLNGDIYVDNGAKFKVEKWSVNATNSVVVMNVSHPCTGLFVDVANRLYCSLRDEFRVVMQPLDVGVSKFTTVAGIYFNPGRDSNKLRLPEGIFVDINNNLYVADTYNDRIQLFRFGELNGTTVMGRGTSLSIILYHPTGIFLDNDGCLFVVDRDNNRVVASKPNGLYCVVGCSDSLSAPSNQLKYPTIAAFDNHGNIFVADRGNKRIQKFLLKSNSFGK